MVEPTLVLSLDFELFWGMQDVRSLDSYKANILGAREAIPRLLCLLEKHEIHATWATVGFIFAQDAEEALRYAPEPAQRPTYTNPARSCYRLFDDRELLAKEADCFFAPEIVRKISETPGMEIGAHTFSHFYCCEKGQTTEQFAADMRALRRIAQDKGYDLKSVVLPRNNSLPEYTGVLSELGFTSFRDLENNWIYDKIKPVLLMRMLNLMDVYLPLTGQGGYTPKKEQGIWNLMGSRMYKPFFRPLFFMEKLKLHRIKRQMLHAAKHGLVFHLWWHPHNIGARTDWHLAQLEEIFSYYDTLRKQYGMRSMNMREMADAMETGAD